MTLASLIAGEAFAQGLLASLRRRSRDWDSPYSEGSEVKTVPTLGEIVAVVTSYPGVGEVCSTPGIFRAMSFTSRTTLSVRARLEPGGSWMTMAR